MEILSILFGLILLISLGYRFFFMAVRVFTRRKHVSASAGYRYAVLIAARDEEAVVGKLIDSIHAQDYPKELVDVYVVADNCADDTANVCRAHGAVVYERTNETQVSKGYALEFLTKKINETGEVYDGYFVFDADNLLAPDYISAMNAVFVKNHHITVGYRNAKNFGDSWITAAYGLYFIYESEFLNRPRCTLGTSCFLSGTGCLFPASFLEGGWRWTGLTEDLQCTMEIVTTGNCIDYCCDAMLYDEQPRSFSESIVQRSRWVRGYTDLIKHNGFRIFKKIFAPHGFAAFDYLMNLAPLIATVGGLLLEIIRVIVMATQGAPFLAIALHEAFAFVSVYFSMLFLGAVTLVFEWKRILCPAYKKILYTLLYPFYMVSYVIVYLTAITHAPQWKAIRHDVAIDIDELMK